MIKKYNENWESLDNNSKGYDLISLPGECWHDVYKRAKNLSISRNRQIKYLFNEVEHIVYPHTNKDDLYNKYLKEIEEKKGDNKNNSKEYWDNYWNKITRNLNYEMDTIADFAKKNSISYEEAKSYFISKEKKNSKKVEFKDGFKIIGLPSGQVLYMNTEQLKYFKNRELVSWVRIWKKPISNGFIPISVESYCFEDKKYEHIIELINIITWK